VERDYYDRTYYGSDKRECRTFQDKAALLERKLILRTIERSGAKTILDVGCGTGNFVSYFTRKGYDITGIDLSSEAISQARKGCPGCSFICHDIMETPFPQKADLVYSTQVIEHIFDVDRFLSHLKSSLNRGGLLIITTPNILAPRIRLGMLVGKDVPFRDLSHIRFFSPSHLKKVMRKNGFRIVSVSGTGRLAFLSADLSGNLRVIARG
jgi:2-polyprenyl-3-methyl-5-hydroxy-6-metoxy-1,4-benzoquinol methylase